MHIVWIAETFQQIVSVITGNVLKQQVDKYFDDSPMFIAPCGAEAPPPFPLSLVHLLRHLFFTFTFLSLALPIFFFCPSLPFLPE